MTLAFAAFLPAALSCPCDVQCDELHMMLALTRAADESLYAHMQHIMTLILQEVHASVFSLLQDSACRPGAVKQRSSLSFL